MDITFAISVSHPIWVRGLKPILGQEGWNEGRSHPIWVRGLKLITLNRQSTIIKSHPIWVRGLKLYIRQELTKAQKVAPYMGAWIETIVPTIVQERESRSHPIWVRGLKHNSKYL